MTAGKVAIAIVVLIAPIVYCEWLATQISAEHWGYAIGVSFTFLAVATALVTALESHLFPASYFAPQRFEREGRIYRWTGIQVFVAFLRSIGWERLWRRQIPVRNDLDALRKYSDGTRGSEALHVVAGICTAGLTLSIGLRYSLLGTKWLWLLNALVNIYPIMLQRYNRPRVERLIRRLERSSTPASTEQSDAHGAAVADGIDVDSPSPPSGDP